MCCCGDIPDAAYVSFDLGGRCVFCGHWEDLRFGVCFDCADTVPDAEQKVQVEKWEAEHSA